MREDLVFCIFFPLFGLRIAVSVYRRGRAQEANRRYCMLAKCDGSECRNIPKLALGTSRVVGKDLPVG